MLNQKGFSIQYKEVSCGGDYMISDNRFHTLSSPGYPHPSDDNMDCIFKLQARPGKKIELSLYIDIEDQDFIEVRDGNISLGQFGGHGLRKQISSMNGLVTLRFYTNDKDTGPGFHASYRQTDIDECITNTHNCDDTATCENTDGGYKCVCEAGFFWNGNTCDMTDCSGKTTIHISGRRYHFIKTKATFIEARLGCELWGGADSSLASFTSPDVQHCITQMITSDGVYKKGDWRRQNPFKRGVWFGATDLQKEGIWKWEDGSLLDPKQFSNWGPSEPNDRRPGEDCANMLLTSPKDGYEPGTWMDTDCSVEQFFICQDDVDECAENRHNCHRNARCANTIGGFTCTCMAGYIGDGTTCELNVLGPDKASIENCAGIDSFLWNGFTYYLLYTNRLSYQDAINSCSDWDKTAILATISSSDLQTCLTQMITDPKVNNPDDWEDVPSRFEIGVWFGGNDIESEGNWVWQDQSPMPTSSASGEFENWGDYDPNNFGGNQDCASALMLNVNVSYPAGSWVDNDCEITQFAFCQADFNECAVENDCDEDAECTNTEGSYECTCNEGYSGDGSVCLDVDECTAGTDNCDENAECSNNDGSFSCVCKEGYTGDGIICTSICSGKGTVILSGKEYRLIQEKMDWYNTNGGCSKWAVDNGNTPGALASILNEETQTCFHDMITSDGVYNEGDWVDEDLYHRGVWIGGNDVSIEDSWRWQDGTLMPSSSNSSEGFQNWAPHDPDNLGVDGEDCASMLLTAVPDDEGYVPGTWVDVDCSTSIQFYMCERDIDECNLNLDNCDENAECINTDGSFDCVCKEGYTGDGVTCTSVCSGQTTVSIAGKEYHIVTDDKVDWYNANTRCTQWAQDNGATPGALASILNSQTQICFTEMLTYNENDWSDEDLYHRGVWIGGNDVSVEDSWRWQDGTPMPSSSNSSEGFQNWAPHDPDNLGVDGEDCASMLLTAVPDDEGYVPGTWVDVDCSTSTQFYMCERDIDECNLNLDNCDENAECTNTDGSFTCTCKSGYTGDGMNCEPLAIKVTAVDCSGKTSAVIEGNEYQLFESRVSFQDARTGCANWAGTTSAVLTSILDQTTQTCITRMLSSDGVYSPDDWSDQPDVYERGAWIGGNDMETESNWVWEDGSQMPTSQDEGFENWGNQDPNDYDDDQDCASALIHTVNDDYTPGTWLDAQCIETQFYICQRDFDECSANADNCDENAECINTDGSFDCVCKEGYTGDGVTCTSVCSGQTTVSLAGKEYHIVTDEKVDWYNANTRCTQWAQDNGATPGALASILNSQTQICFTEMLTYNENDWSDEDLYHRGVWIGGNDVSIEDSWRWQDGTPMPSSSNSSEGFQNWAPHDPDNLGVDGEDCASMLLTAVPDDEGYVPGTWVDVDCSTSIQFYMCERDIDECNLNLDNCDENAECTNTDGSFTCTCNSGYTGDGMNCEPLAIQVTAVDCSGKTSAVIEGNEYQLFESRVSIQDARTGCANWAGTTSAVLTSILDQTTQTCITQMLSSDGVYNPDDWSDQPDAYERGAWIGGNDMETESNWVWEDGSQMPTSQDEGFENWGNQDPNDYDDDQDCASALIHTVNDDYTPGTWLDAQCIETQFYICQRDFDECSANADNCDENAECINTDGSFDCVCKEGYTGDGVTCTSVCSGQTTVSLAGKEYHIVTDEKVDWYNANTRCTQWAQDNGATPGALASILNSQTQICFTEMLTYNENDWSDEDLYHRGVWIGGNDVSIEDSWRWQDGTPMPSSSNSSEGFQNWAPHDPDNLGVDGEDCASMLLTAVPDDEGYVPGTWVDVDCSTSIQFYMCERDIDECNLNLDNCDENAECTNTDGSFTCTCNSGYTGDGMNCEPLAIQVTAVDCSGKTSAVIEGNEYQLFESRVSFQDARTGCANWAGTTSAVLTSILDQTTQTCITQMLSSDGVYNPDDWSDQPDAYERGAWIGGNDMETESNWVWEDGSQMPTSQDEGFENWGNQDLNDYDDDQDCASALIHTVNDDYTPGTWLDAQCIETQFYICQRDFDECSANADNCDENAECINTDGSFDCVCKEGYTGDGVTCTSVCSGQTTVSLAGKEYHIVTDEKVDWYNANTRCTQWAQDNGATPGALASILNSQTQICFTEMLTYNENDWSDEDLYHRGVWIGGNDVSIEDSWRWQDGTPMPSSSNSSEGFQNWAPHDPDNLGVDGEDCASMLLTAVPDDEGYVPGTWVDVDCSTSIQFYMCERDIDECNLNLDNCDENAECTNTDGSFTCTCNSGYTGDGMNCEPLAIQVTAVDCSGKTSAVIEGNEYQLFESRVSFQDARTGCANWAGTTSAVLTSILDQTTQTCITQMLSSDGVYNPDDWSDQPDAYERGAWIGGNDMETESNWVWEDGSQMPTSQDEGFENWGNQDPNDYDDDQDCASALIHTVNDDYTPGTWLDAQCIETQFYICQRDFDECSANADNCDENAECINTDGSFDCVCKEGYTGDGVTCTSVCSGQTTVSLAGKEYHIVTDEKVDWYNANTRCTQWAQDNGATPGALASILNSQTQICFTEMLTYNENDWSDEDLYHRGVWIGGNDVSIEDSWRWQDGTPMPSSSNSSEGFQNWAPHDPDNLGVDGEDCASMLLTAVPDDEGYVPGTWVDVDCSTSIQFYMCERDIDECNLNLDNCDENAECTNTDGSFTCTCNSGYTGDGMNCEPLAIQVTAVDCSGKTSAVIEGNEYQLFESRVSFQDARTGCANWAGTTSAVLTSILDQTTQTCITQMLSSDGVYNPDDWSDQPDAYERGAWIGGNDMETESNWVWEDGSQMPTSQDEGFENWGNQDPNDYDDDQDCASALIHTVNDDYTPGTWLDAQCIETQFYICQRDFDECSANADSCDENAECINTDGSFDCVCKEGYTGDGVTCTSVCSGQTTVSLAGKEYHIVTDEKVDWYNANTRCTQWAQDNGATPGALASILNSQTQICFTEMLTYNENDWSDEDLYHRGVWIGGNDVSIEDSWRWQDGTPMPSSSNSSEGFQNWAPHDPDNLGVDGEDCASMLLTAVPDDEGYVPGTWVDVDCSTSIQFYMCERDIDECNLNLDNCDENAECTNTDGSFTCTCNSGYTGDGMNCEPLAIQVTAVDCSGKTSAVIEGNEYQLFESRVSFQDARTGCANWAGTTSAVLTSILDQTTQTCITQMLSSDGVYNPDDWSDQPDAYERGAWIGGNDMETESNWVWEDGSQMPTSQDEGFENWGNQDPNDYDDDQDCASALIHTVNDDYTPGTWLDAQCIETQFYICQRDFDECSANADSCDENAECINTDGSFDCVCKEGYTGDGVTCTSVCSGQTTVSLAGKEYHIVTDEKVDWYNANTRCTQWAQDNGATPGALASILNSQTQICFTEMLTYNENDWSDEDLYHRGVWIGGNDVSIEDSWRWQDGTPMPSSSNSSEGFQNWAPHDPDNLGVDGEDCASMLLTAVPDDEGYVPGTWVDVDCSTSIQFYMCERDIDECNLNLDNCDENAECTNTDGSFTCTCNSGYTGDGMNCEPLAIQVTAVDCSGKTSAVIEGNEYQLFESRVSFQDARTGCANWAGTTSAVLTSILDQTTQTCITQMLSSDGVYNPDDWSDQPDAYERGAWIGGNDMETESNWVWEDGSQMPTSQDEGFENWGNQDPNDYDDDQDCASALIHTVNDDYTPGTWLDAQCIETQFYICQRDFDECSANADSCDENAECINTDGSFDCVCKEGYTGDGVTCTSVCSGQTTVSLAGKEYHIVTDEKVDWYNANTRCTQWAQDNGATPGALASILNSQTQICFTEMLTYNENDWSDEDLYHRGVWIGGNDVSIEDSWRWQDGTPMPSSSNSSEGFQNWAPHDPDNLGVDGEDCASMLLTAVPDDEGYVPGTWVDVDCSTSIQFYMCERDIDECNLNLDNCDENAECTNTDGSFTCTCNSGYTGDGMNCEPLAIQVTAGNNLSKYRFGFQARFQPSLDCSGKTSAVIEGNEYQLFESRVSFQDARTGCANWAGTTSAVLTSILDQTTQTCITQMLSSDGVYNPDDWSDQPDVYEHGAWFGGNDITSEGDWVWENGSPMPISEDSGEFVNWGALDPNNYDDKQDCASMLIHTLNSYYVPGTWLDTDCADTQYYVCRRDYDECVANFDNCDENAECINTDGGFDCVCNEGYTGDGFTCTHLCTGQTTVILNDKEYHIVTDEKVDWYNANTACTQWAQDNGATQGALASILNSQTQICFTEMLTYNENEWSDEDLYHRGVWIGGNDVSVEDSWRWQDGTPMPSSSNSSEGFQNWAPHDPDNLGADGEDCASMLLTAVPDDEGYVPGTWVDVDCSTSTQFYMCERVVTNNDAP
ncbi:uncharacterized protein LOC143468345 isoform X3 [Clavelina lepadiformis]|uniref:uncharacterized protein LOC143468345 isoform X3 n=1 Tax=Clavelina lepadiformis TaxID=159417 RepID=UPI0040428BC6